MQVPTGNPQSKIQNSMSHLALYRKYRSQTFSDLVGQEHVVRTLQNGITKGRISHAYLFTGPRGTGKTSTARLLAKALNCEKGPSPEPCNECQSCQEITIGNCMDVIEMDAASESGVEGMRESVVETADYRPAYCRYKVFIIDEVHDLSRQAFDALLKTVEEPPDHIVFILATTEFSKVPPTIRSRCQRFDFHRGTVKDLVDRLKFVVEAEGSEAEPAALTAIARMSDGGFRDALTLLEQAILTSEGKITLQHVYDQLGLVSDETVDRILAAMAQSDVPNLIDALENVYRMGRDPRSLLESVMHRMSDLTRAAFSIEIGGLDDSAQEAGLKATAGSLGTERLLAFRAALAEAHRNIRDVTIPRIWLEAELVRISRGAQEPQVERRQPVAAQTVKPPVTVKTVEPTVEQLAVKPEEAKPAVTPEPVVAVEPTDDPALAGLRIAWATIVHELSELSAVAKERLAKTRVDRVEAGTAMVEFSKNMHLEMVTGSKLEKGIRERWAKYVGEETAVQFFFDSGKSAPVQAVVEPTAVELPAEGERLVELVHEVFGSSGRSPE